MCGRHVSPETAAIEAQWKIGRRTGTLFSRRFNVAPAAEVPIVYREGGGLVLAAARWGFVPHWWKDAKPPRVSHNARLEEAAFRPMWRDALRHTRCLLPVQGWYEWREDDRQPWYFYRRDGRLAALAGLMSCWKDPAAQATLVTCAVLTTAASGAPARVHDRMPVALCASDELAWLDAAAARGDAEAIALHPVRRLVNSSRAEGAELIEPATA